MQAINIIFASAWLLEVYILIYSLQCNMCCHNTPDCVSNACNIIMVIVTYCAYCKAKEEYKKHVEEVKVHTLSKYNEGYSTDKNIKKVLDYITHDSNVKLSLQQPTTNEKEMFLRFFEELEIMMHKELLNENEVYILFAYYAIEISRGGKYNKSFDYKDIEDKSEWAYFRDFVKRMKDYSKKNNLWKNYFYLLHAVCFR